MSALWIVVRVLAGVAVLMLAMLAAGAFFARLAKHDHDPGGE